MKFLSFLICAFFFFNSLLAKPRELSLPANILAIGPEFYHLERTRSGGSFQHGEIIGVRANYDHIKRYKFYWGVQGLYAYGILNGEGAKRKDGSKRAKLRSQWTDEMIEGNLGYTFQCKNSPYFSFTPYAGYGYFREVNKFISPSPLHVKFATVFDYFTCGFLSSAVVAPGWKVGLNARYREPYDLKCKISDDPEIDDWNQRIGPSFQYRIELPIVYNPYFECWSFEFQIMPFYEQRNYGEWKNYPCDYPETKIEIYGFNLQVLYLF